jgi:hypothetical protein
VKERLKDEKIVFLNPFFLTERYKNSQIYKHHGFPRKILAVVNAKINYT